MKFNKITISLIILLFILIFSGYAAAKDISFNSESGDPGDTVIVSINVNNLSGIAGFNISLNYDPTVLAAIYSAAGADVPSGLFIGNVLDPNGPGTVSLTMAGATASTDTGSGELATVTFDILPNADKNGTLTFTSITLKNEDGNEIAGTNLANGAVAVSIVTVTPLAIGNTPTHNVMNSGDTNSFTISGGNSGGDETRVNWTTSSGQITTAGVFTAPTVADGSVKVVNITATDEADPDLSTNFTLKVYGVPVVDLKPQGYIDGVPSTYPLLRLGSNTILTAMDNTRNYNWTVKDWNGTVVDSQTGSLTCTLNPDTLFAVSGAGIYTVTLQDADYGGLTASTLMVRVPMQFIATKFGEDSGVYDDTQGTDTYTITGGPSVNAYHYRAMDLMGNEVTLTNCGRFETASTTDADNVFLFTNGIPNMIAYRVMVTLDSSSNNLDIQRLIDSDLEEVWSGIFRIVPLVAYNGTIVDEDGVTPVPGVTVTAINDATKTDITDVNGAFSITNLQDAGVIYRFKLTKGGYIEKAVTGAQIEAGPIKLEALGAGSGTISGSVILSGSAILPDDVAIKAKNTNGDYVTDGEGDVITAYTTSGNYTFPIPASFAGEGPYSLEFRKTGYIYIEGTALGRLTNVSLNSIVADISLKPVTHIMVTGTPEDDNADGTFDNVLVRITAKRGPEASLYDDFSGVPNEIKVIGSNGNGIPLYTFASDGAATWSFTHNAYENFSIRVDADVTDDNDVDNNYTATKVWSYVKTATAPAMTTITDPCTSGGKASSTSGDTTVNIPPGGLTGEIRNSVVVSIVESDTGVEIEIMDDSGEEIENNKIGRIEITMKFDPSLVPSGSIENGDYVIYQADTLEDMATGVYSQVSLDQIILPIDYTNGYLTFWVNHLTAFGIGTGGGLSSGSSDGGGGGSCFINTSLSRHNPRGSMTCTLILVFLSVLTIGSARVRNKTKGKGN